MDSYTRLLKLMTYLATNHSDIDINNLQHGEKEQRAVLSAIKAFANYDYDPNHKFFTTDNKGVMFATENIELKQITTILELYHAIDYLNQAYEKRLKGMEKTIALPKRFYTEPKQVQDISRDNIMAFLQQSYGLNSEKELFELKDKKQKEAIYDLYRNFTGFIPHEKTPGSIIFSIPQEPDLKLRYSDLPDFTNTNLYSHIRDMRNVKRNTQQMIWETTTERIEQIKQLSKDKLKEKENNQEKEQEL